MKLAAPVVSLHSACRKLLLEVVIPELPYKLQNYLLYPCIPFSNNTTLKVYFFLITVSYFSFIYLIVTAYLLRLHLRSFVYLVIIILESFNEQ